jgi:hypothetical protein
VIHLEHYGFMFNAADISGGSAPPIFESVFGKFVGPVLNVLLGKFPTGTY